jgi:AcrR family transcriptional regulator
MHEIAVAAGVTKPVLYQHFASKRDLYLELLQDVSDRLLSAIRTAVEAVDAPGQRVEAGFRAYFRFVADHPDAFRLLFGGGARRDEEFAERVREVEDTIAAATAAWIEADIDEDHRRLLGHALVGLAEGTSRHWVAAGLDLDPDLLALRVTDLAWAGLRGIRRVDALPGATVRP